MSFRHSLFQTEIHLGTDRLLILKSFEVATESVLPKNLMRKQLTVRGGILEIKQAGVKLDLSRFDKVIAVGAGKAGGGMAESLECILKDDVDLTGIVSVPEAALRLYNTKRIKLVGSTHPKPSSKGISASKHVLKLLRTATSQSLVICLLSGGGSSLLPLPAEGISLQDKVAVTDLLLKSGASIEKMNCVRKHLSAIKGGQLLNYTHGAKVLSLIISDVIGNRLDAIASGPTVPDTTTFGEALRILREYNLTKRVPASVVERFRKGARSEIPDTPKLDDPIFKRVRNIIIGDNTVACKSAISILSRKFRTYYLGSSWSGEARATGRNLASLCLSIGEDRIGNSFRTPCALVWGGEASVSVSGKGRGGRNQEETLAALQVIRNSKRVTIGFLGTDGKDGSSDIAGAIVDGRSYESAQRKRLDPERYLRNNDSYNFLAELAGCTIKTGLTGTNVSDIGIAVVK